MNAKEQDETRRRRVRRNYVDQRPSLIDEGNPVSQPRGEFHGRSERFSDSVVAQPVKINEALARSDTKSKKRKIFIFQFERTISPSRTGASFHPGMIFAMLRSGCTLDT